MKSWLLDSRSNPAHPLARVLWPVFALLALSFLCWFFLHGAATQWAAVWEYRRNFMDGWLLTILLSLGALAGSVVLGLAAALARRSPFLPLRAPAMLYIEIVRGSPFLVLILIGFYVVLHQAGVSNRLFSGWLLLSVFSGAYIAEIIRAGIEGVGASQLESAKAIGLTPLQTYRYVIFPQALRGILPPLAGQFASLIKDSSLLSIIGISELTFAAQQAGSATYSTIEALLPLAPMYLILTLPVSLLSRHLEKRLHFDT